MVRLLAVAWPALALAVEGLECFSHNGAGKGHGADSLSNMTCIGSNAPYDSGMHCARWKTLKEHEVSSGCDRYDCTNFVGPEQIGKCCVMNRGQKTEKKIICYDGDWNGGDIQWEPGSGDTENYTHLNRSWDDPEFCPDDCDPSGCGETNNMRCTKEGQKVLGSLTHRHDHQYDNKEGVEIADWVKNKGGTCMYYRVGKSPNASVGCDDSWCEIIQERDKYCKMLFRDKCIYCSSRGSLGRNPKNSDFTGEDCNKSCSVKFRDGHRAHELWALALAAERTFGSLHALTISLLATLLLVSSSVV